MLLRGALARLSLRRGACQDIRFVPLKQEREFNAAELIEFYKTVRLGDGIACASCSGLDAGGCAGPKAQGVSAAYQRQLGVSGDL